MVYVIWVSKPIVTGAKKELMGGDSGIKIASPCHYHFILKRYTYMHVSILFYIVPI